MRELDAREGAALLLRAARAVRENRCDAWEAMLAAAERMGVGLGGRGFVADALADALELVAGEIGLACAARDDRDSRRRLVAEECLREYSGADAGTAEGRAMVADLLACVREVGGVPGGWGPTGQGAARAGSSEALAEGDE